jgi:hypothetical protein
MPNDYPTHRLFFLINTKYQFKYFKEEKRGWQFSVRNPMVAKYFPPTTHTAPQSETFSPGRTPLG